ncbi:MAG: dihydrolipoyllysine-residue acetyltransferase [Pseudoxanthomonas suwonensis]|nr:dihydrolipoyllysine-residue acetyltransferase [Pseudoxanthomonas suwonensis]
MSNLVEARVPDIGGHADVPVIEVLVKVGDTVAVDQGLVTLESDKATMEVPSSVAGVVKELKVKVGDTLAEGALVAMIESADADAAADTDAPAAAAAAAKSGSGAGKAAADDKPTADDNAAEEDRQQERARPERAQPESGQAPVSTAETGETVEPVVVDGKADNIAQASIEREPAGAVGGPGKPPVRFEADAVLPGKVPYASPGVRLFARELGVDLFQVGGSGRSGRITREDVQKFVKQSLAGGTAAAAAHGGGGSGLDLLPWPKVDFGKFGEIEVQPLSRIKKISGANLARNWAMIPHVTHDDDADITELEALRVQLNKEHEKEGVKLTMLAFLMKASVQALKKFPEFNASLDASGENLTLKKYFHIGFAADTPNGLVVPVVRDCDRKGVLEIARETGDLAKKARDGKLGPAEMSGGCFSISSLGGIGGTGFTPIVNAPEVAILGVTRAAMKPVWNGETFHPRLILPMSLSYDHRVIDGAAAARFAAYLAQLLGDMRRVLL